MFAKVGREDWVDSRSVEARSRSSESVEGSERRDWSSEKDCSMVSTDRDGVNGMSVHRAPLHTPSVPL